MLNRVNRRVNAINPAALVVTFSTDDAETLSWNNCSVAIIDSK